MTRETKLLIERAARLQGVATSEFVIAYAVRAARDVIDRTETTKITAKNRDAFFQALDAEPNERLRELMQWYVDVSSKPKRARRRRGG